MPTRLQASLKKTRRRVAGDVPPMMSRVAAWEIDKLGRLRLPERQERSQIFNTGMVRVASLPLLRLS
jgi:hypothetical protein